MVIFAFRESRGFRRDGALIDEQSRISGKRGVPCVAQLAKVVQSGGRSNDRSED
jgi:hypothetical protein